MVFDVVNRAVASGTQISGFDWIDITRINMSCNGGGNQITAPGTRISSLEELDTADLVRFLATVIKRATLHSSIWFDEVQHQLGLEEALIIERNVADLLFPIVTRRITGVMGVHTTERPISFGDMPREKLITLIDALCLNWLAADGIWFQAIENRHDIWTSKSCNDEGWMKFSPLEAQIIQSFLGLPYHSGLDGLRRALGFRLCSRINHQTTEISNNSLTLRTTKCRVQDARKRKGLQDYPCKSAGLAEYTTFARSIDPRISTECLGCPPEKEASPWACAWQFSEIDLKHVFDHKNDLKCSHNILMQHDLDK